MPFTFRARVTGLRGVFAALNGVDDKVRNVILRKALGEASKIVLKDAKAKVPVAYGLLRRSLGRKVKTYRKRGVVVIVIGPRTGFKTVIGLASNVAAGHRGSFGMVETKTLYANPTHYAHLVEKGTRRSAAKPFMRPALDNNESAIRNVIADLVRQGIRDAAVNR